jgi:hypothetical protein
MLVADAICDREVRCGAVEIMCMGGTNQATECSATIVFPRYEQCLTDVKGGVERVLACATITPLQVDLVESCADAWAAVPCTTQSEADAVARAAETQMSVPAKPQPPECDVVRTFSCQ